MAFCKKLSIYKRPGDGGIWIVGWVEQSDTHQLKSYTDGRANDQGSELSLSSQSNSGFVTVCSNL